MARRASLDNGHMHVIVRKIRRGSYFGGLFHLCVKVHCHGNEKSTLKGQGKIECLVPSPLSAGSVKLSN